jgi:tRNA 2-thiouridine synthesizing protein B
MLFTLQHSPYQCDFPALLRLISQDDVLLLLQDGVIAAVNGGTAMAQLQALNIKTFALREDVQARGLAVHISHSVPLVDYTGFVALTEQHHQQLAW